MKSIDAKTISYFVPFAFALACMLPLGAHAKTLYVDATSGSDVTSYSNNDASHSWRTIARAAWGSTTYASPNTSQAAQAGDVVLIAAGIYWENGNPSGDRWSVALRPANSGTSGNPITFRGVGNVYIRLNNGIRGPMIGCVTSHHYITWDHFIIDDYYGGSMSDTGPVVFTGGSTYCQLINSEVLGHSGSYYWGYATFGANYNAVRLEYATNTLIRNNRIHRVHAHATGVGGQNEAGIMTYDSDDNIIEHNELFNCGVGVWIKGVRPSGARFLEARNIIRYNYVHNNVSGLRVSSGYQTKVYQNIVTNNVEYGLWAGFFQSESSHFINNTVYNSGVGNIVPQHTGDSDSLIDVHFKNNIITNSPRGIYNWSLGSPSVQDIHFDRNLYFNLTNHANYTGGNTSFSTWQSAYSQDLNGISGSNPLFVNPGANNFKLQAGSPALTLGRVVEGIGGNNGDVIPAGAYITGAEIIGLLSQSSDVIPPQPPANLRVQ